MIYDDITAENCEDEGKKSEMIFVSELNVCRIHRKYITLHTLLYILYVRSQLKHS